MNSPPNFRLPVVVGLGPVHGLTDLALSPWPPGTRALPGAGRQVCGSDGSTEPLGAKRAGLQDLWNVNMAVVGKNRVTPKWLALVNGNMD